MELLKCIGLGLVATVLLIGGILLFGAFSAASVHLLGEVLGGIVSIVLPILVMFTWIVYDIRKGY